MNYKTYSASTNLAAALKIRPNPYCSCCALEASCCYGKFGKEATYEKNNACLTVF